MKTFDELVKQWLELQESGKVEEAQKLYEYLTGRGGYVLGTWADPGAHHPYP